MNDPKKYRKKDATHVVAVPLDLNTDGLTYQKWGGEQTAKAGDWLVNNGGEVYTIDQESFAATYSPVSLGIFTKTAAVWAYEAGAPGSVLTKEGRTRYKRGDWVVSNDPNFSDQYAMEAVKFHELYELDER